MQLTKVNARKSQMNFNFESCVLVLFSLANFRNKLETVGKN